MKDDFDRYADEQEYKADQQGARDKLDHDLWHRFDCPVDDCQYCEAEFYPANEESNGEKE